MATETRTEPKDFHPISRIFPLMGEAALNDLAEDIGKNGQHEPIWLHPDGQIIDGRNRYMACNKKGIEPRYQYWNSDDDLLAFVMSLNFHRRHLTASQRAAVGVKAKKY